MILTSRQRLLVFIVAAFVIDYLPLINLPFLWSETFFHEISHGLAAVLTGGTIHNISLNFDGSGVAKTIGGWGFLVSFSGYAGSALWGLLIYSISSALSQSKAKYIVGTVVVVLGMTLLLWARDLPTIIVLVVLLAMYVMPLVKSQWFTGKWFSVLLLSEKVVIQLVGVFVMLDAIRSPLYLLDGRNLGDGATLAQLTWLPEFFWVTLWFAIAVGCLYLLWRKRDQV
jgi:hypothetical protein